MRTAFEEARDAGWTLRQVNLVIDLCDPLAVFVLYPMLVAIVASCVAVFFVK
jgi:hypothetical protein